MLSRGSQETLPQARYVPAGHLTEFFAWSCTTCGLPSFPRAFRGRTAWWEPAVGYGIADFCKRQEHSLGVWAQISRLEGRGLPGRQESRGGLARMRSGLKIAPSQLHLPPPPS